MLIYFFNMANDVNTRKNDFSNRLKKWFNDDTVESSKKFFDNLNYTFDNSMKIFNNFDCDELSKYSKERINGLFDKLNEDDQKTVVDTVNNIQSFIDNIFGTKHEKYTVDDFKGCNVDVNTDVPKTDKLKTEAKNDIKENETVNNEKNNILNDLLSELAENENTVLKAAADNIVNYVIDTINDKKHKKYTLYPGSKDYLPRVEITVPKEIFKSVKNIYEQSIKTKLFELVHDSLIKKIKAYNVYIKYYQDEYLLITIPLKPEKSK